jgi:rhodanese-related sulfurtransferase
VGPRCVVPIAVLVAACSAEPGTVELSAPQEAVARDVELARLSAELRAELPDVQTMGVDALAARMQAGERPLLLDVRSQAEFTVSHLEGARRAETKEDAQALLAGEPREREVILYCSVGVRSGHLAEALRRAGWTNVRNLEGSIFAWANAGHPVWRDGLRVHEVHPYDEHWGRLLERSLWSELE